MNTVGFLNEELKETFHFSVPVIVKESNPEDVMFDCLKDKSKEEITQMYTIYKNTQKQNPLPIEDTPLGIEGKQEKGTPLAVTGTKKPLNVKELIKKGGATPGTYTQCYEFIDKMDSVQKILECVNVKTGMYNSYSDIESEYLNKKHMAEPLKKYMCRYIEYFKDILDNPIAFPGIIMRCFRQVVIGNIFNKFMNWIRFDTDLMYGIHTLNSKNRKRSIESDGVNLILDCGYEKGKLPAEFDDTLLVFKIQCSHMKNKRQVLQYCLLASLIKFAFTLLDKKDYQLVYNSPHAYPYGFKFSFYHKETETIIFNNINFKKGSEYNEILKMLKTPDDKTMFDALVGFLPDRKDPNDENEVMNINKLMLIFHVDKIQNNKIYKDIKIEKKLNILTTLTDFIIKYPLKMITVKNMKIQFITEITKYKQGGTLNPVNYGTPKCRIKP